MSTITLGLDLGDRASRYAVLAADAHLVGEGSVATTREAMQDFFSALPMARVILEVGTHAPWVSRVVASCGHAVIVANPRRVRLISAAVRKNDRIDAVTLARLSGPTLRCSRRFIIAARPAKPISGSSARATHWCGPGPC